MAWYSTNLDHSSLAELVEIQRSLETDRFTDFALESVPWRSDRRDWGRGPGRPTTAAGTSGTGPGSVLVRVVRAATSPPPRGACAVAIQCYYLLVLSNNE